MSREAVPVLRTGAFLMRPFGSLPRNVEARSPSGRAATQLKRPRQYQAEPKDLPGSRG